MSSSPLLPIINPDKCGDEAEQKIERKPRSLTMLWLDHPIFLFGDVVKGFGRGSKQLGIPTANFAESVIKSLPKNFKTGIYFGLAQVPSYSQEVFNMVMSCGWNPFYQNEKLSAETHIIHDFPNEFYGVELRVLIAGYIRPEWNFTHVKHLIKAIKDDIAFAEKTICTKDMAKWKRMFFES
ncbi:riboflavin kinase-like [Symsagittifera roscoffensis]|uniref:riboflavin kinase-like n=1 Tax=Symsagittifera roscoffensis TaxID=84072 RepID=UPI00307C9BB0